MNEHSLVPNKSTKILPSEGPSRAELGVSSAELLVFVMDGSGSMLEPKTYDGKPKIDHLWDIVKAVLERLNTSSKRGTFRVSFIYFSEKPILEEVGGAIYFPVDVALNHLKKATDVAGSGNTWIAGAVAKAGDVIDTFSGDIGVPKEKYATVFLFTDGLVTVGTNADVENEAKKLLSRTDPITTIATISFGLDADENLLKKIASRPKDIQLQVLDKAGVISELPDPNTLFVQGHAQGELTKTKAQVIRNFVETLSLTKLGFR
ncbi:MAG: VWA domain-containing protein [Candidatus Jordarchaeaceae archaeon]